MIFFSASKVRSVSRKRLLIKVLKRSSGIKRRLYKWCSLGLFSLAFFFLPACQRIDLSESLVKITPVSPLIVQDGVDVNWQFKAEIGNRPIKIMSIFEDRLPLGVTISSKNGNWVISGKALRSRNSDGHVKVSVFDEDGCKQILTDGLGFFDKILARFGFKVRGHNPLCEYSLHQQNSYFAKSALFAWYSAQYSSSSPETLKSTFANLAKKSLASPEKTEKNAVKSTQVGSRDQAKIFVISPLEAPHQALSFLDDCFSIGYGQCGIKSDCAWHSGSCASISKHNLKLVGK